MTRQPGMFETVVPPLSIRQRRTFYQSLPMSLAAHATAIGVILAAVNARVELPVAPPRPALSWLMVDGGGGLPQPPEPAGPPSAASSAHEPAPAGIPDHPPATQRSGHSREAGETAGVETGIKGGVLMADGRIHFGRGGLLPVAALAMDYPAYPENARRARLEGDVVLRYVVGTDGVVEEVTVVEPGILPAFDAAAIEAVRAWRFEPLVYEGVARAVVHEVTISFRLRR